MATDIRMAIWSANERTETVQRNRAAYTAAHPDVNVKFDSRALTVHHDADHADRRRQCARPRLDPRDHGSRLRQLRVHWLAQATFKGSAGYDLPDVTQSSLALWSAGSEIYAYRSRPRPSACRQQRRNQSARPEDSGQLIALANGSGTTRSKIDEAVAAAGKQGLIVRDFDYKVWDNLGLDLERLGATPWSADGKTLHVRRAADGCCDDLHPQAIFTRRPSGSRASQPTSSPVKRR